MNNKNDFVKNGMEGCLTCKFFSGSDCTLGVDDICIERLKEAKKYYDEEKTSLEDAPSINGCEMTKEWEEMLIYTNIALELINIRIKSMQLIKKASNTINKLTDTTWQN